jgi:PAS domain S-box-containing protein
MKKQDNAITDKKTLRLKAEEQLKKLRSKAASIPIEADTLKLIHELEVHQIELEMQNEELKLATDKAQQAEEKYLELFDFAPTGYLTLSNRGEIIDLNYSAAGLLGKERAQLINSTFEFFISVDSRYIFNHFLEKIYKSKMKETCEVMLAKHGNYYKYVNISGIVGKNGDQCLIIMMDITRRKQAEKDLLKAKIKAEENDRLKSVFLANISHEIRTPMNGILGFTKLLKQNDLTYEERLEFINIIEDSGLRLLNIINDLVDFSKVESGLMQIASAASNINEQIQTIYTFFKYEVERKGIQFSYQNALPDHEAIVVTDREKIYAILTNLVKNAIKFSYEGTIEFGYEKKGDYLEFFVKDMGIGIAKEKQKDIFKRFIQADSALSRNFEGTGLGLAISKAYVELLGGEIWVESEMGKGSVFYFTIPYNSDFVKEVTAQTEYTDDEIPFRLNKVLIVEDNEVSIMLFTKLINKYCNEILYARNGYEGVKLCRQNPDIEIVLMDISMPVMDGYEATRQIRKFNEDVIIIAQTAHAFKDEKERILEAGCDDYIAKPIDAYLLKMLMRRYLKKDKG